MIQTLTAGNMKELSMYYKLLNKTVLSSALVALICLSGNKALSQDLFGDEEEVKVVIPASDDISFEIEDDIIPLNEEELIQNLNNINSNVNIFILE